MSWNLHVSSCMLMFLGWSYHHKADMQLCGPHSCVQLHTKKSNAFLYLSPEGVVVVTFIFLLGFAPSSFAVMAMHADTYFAHARSKHALHASSYIVDHEVSCSNIMQCDPKCVYCEIVPFYSTCPQFVCIHSCSEWGWRHSSLPWVFTWWPGDGQGSHEQGCWSK